MGIARHVIVTALVVGTWSAPKADLRSETNTRIEQFRKGRLVLKLTDASGQPLSGATISVNQTRHDYRFGASVDCRTSGSGYWDAVKNYYNFGVECNAMKWRNMDRFSQGLQAVDKMRSYGHTVRAHTIFWGRDNMDQQGTSVSKSKLQAHCKDVVGRAKGKVVEWDLNNEILSNSGSVICNYIKEHGEGLWPEMAQWAWSVDPGLRLFFNEFGAEGEKPKAPYYAAFVKRILDRGVPKDKVGIGLQCHMSPIGSRGEQLTAEYLNKCLGTMSTLGIPLEATEFDYDATSDSELASAVELFYRVFFSYPTTIGIVQWGFWGNGGFAPGKRLWFMRSENDFSATGASASIYRKLVFEEWWTKLNKTADAAGSCSLAVFYGTHTIKVTHAKGTAELTLRYPHPRNGSASLNLSGTSALKVSMTTYGQNVTPVMLEKIDNEPVCISKGGTQAQFSLVLKPVLSPQQTRAVDLRGRNVGPTFTAMPRIVHR